MTYRKAVCRGTVATAALIFVAALSGSAQAQDTTPPPNQTDTSGPVEKVTVTGSHIKRRRESTSLPVDVITSEDLEKDGAPTIVEVAKALPVSSGVIGDTNQFDARAQGSEGTASINLRGLGPTRTLVLLNGRRLALNPFGLAGQGIVDTNVIPVAALERIEVLKDGAAATYGSDAIGGVVNFITRKNYDGLNLAGDWRFVKDADGDYSARGVYGYDTDNFNWLLSAGFQHRSELNALDREFTQTEYVENPEGGWTAAGSPGSLLYFSPGTTLRRDAGCASLGGYPGFSGTTPVCQMQYIDFDNLQEEEDKLQVYSSVNYDWSPGHRVFADALYATTEVPHWETTPLYAILSTPSAEEQAQAPGNPAPFFTNRFWISPTNPGLVDYVAQNVAADPTLAGMLVNGAAYLAPAARPLFLGGNPTMPGGASQVAQREYEALRFTGGFEGDFNENLSYEISTTYSRHEAYRNGFDTLTNRFALALKGLGGPNCDKEPNTPGIQGPGGGAAVAGANGCQYWNPFSNAIQRNVLTGQVNPQYNAAVANDIAVLNWFQQELQTNQEASLWVVDALVSGNTGIDLWGGPIEFAVGGQYRRDTFVSEYNDINNALENPCVSSPDYMNDVCPGNQRGPFVFLGVATPADLDGSVYAAFGELAIPLLEDFEINVAARFEDYGGETGSTFDPKISAKWTLNDRIAFRGSAGSTFRGPPLVQLANSNITSLQSVLGTFRAVDIGGNPDLEPESADTFSVGAIFTLPWFRGTIDYWGFDFENPIIAEPLGGMVASLFPNGTALPNNCLVYPALAARFTFTGGVCSAANISRVQTFYVNGSPVTTKGVDVLGEFPIDDNWSLNVSATHVIQYKVAPISVEGVQVQAGFEAAGLLNYQTTVYPIPTLKGSFSVDYDTDVHFVRFTMNYIDNYTDQRTAPFATNAYRDATGAFFTQNAGKIIDEFITFDVNYRWMVMEDMSIAIAVDNIFNEDPPLARLDLSYDPLTHSTLGRTFKLGIRKEF
ncbi:MAG: TonB-dependent receptor [Alphaproteobacteria bacterium]|nr:TonB-dependent receptor [Alphaproteobacteria bacterium]